MNWETLFNGIKKGDYPVLLMEATNILVLVSYIKSKNSQPRSVI